MTSFVVCVDCQLFVKVIDLGINNNYQPAYVNEQQNDWDEWLPYVLFAYRSSTHKSTKQTPFFLTYGRDTPQPTMMGVDQPWIDSLSVDSFAARLVRVTTRARAQAAREIERAQEEMKKYYDRRHADKSYAVGDPVWLYTPGREADGGTAFVKPWRGPFRITKKYSEQVVELTCLRGERVTQRVNVSRLKMALMRPDRLQVPEDTPLLPEDDNFDVTRERGRALAPAEEDEATPAPTARPEGIIGARKWGKQRHYKILYEDGSTKWMARRDVPLGALVRMRDKAKEETKKRKKAQQEKERAKKREKEQKELEREVRNL